MSLVHFCHTPMREVHREPFGVRWCFICRKRLPFDLVVRDVIEQPTYWDPIRQIECPQGHVDGDVFPGWSREWSE